MSEWDGEMHVIAWDIIMGECEPLVLMLSLYQLNGLAVERGKLMNTCFMGVELD